LLSRPKRQEWGKVQPPRKQAAWQCGNDLPFFLKMGHFLRIEMRVKNACFFLLLSNWLASCFHLISRTFGVIHCEEHGLVMNWKNKFQYWTWATIIFTYGNTIVPWQLSQ
jgi:hypothetical protein